MPKKKGIDASLKVLVALLEVDGEINISALAKLAGVKFETVERAVEVLKGMGFVEEERRAVRGGITVRIVRLTEKGRSAAEHAKAILELAGEKLPVHELK